MSTIDLKIEIQKALDHVPEYILEDVLNYLKQIESATMDDVQFTKNLNRVLNEDASLLKKLAQ